ncbi:AAEL000503-PA [Aedes aegypti]|uniref:AAEL000503-PA n=1 Tax=Aedes aegypti TaxID=7159 RepID=Q17P36_AEDAE|nr:AAEL000503-PA [Aedes aegypti]
MIPKSLPFRRPSGGRPAAWTPSSSSPLTFTIDKFVSPRVIDVPAESRLPASVGATSSTFYNNTKLFASTSPIERKLQRRRRPQDQRGRLFKLTKQQITMQTLRDSPAPP